MVVGDFRAVKDTLASGKGDSGSWFVLLVGCQDIIEDALAFRVDVVAEIECIDTRLCGQFHLVERLYGERGFGRVAETILETWLKGCKKSNRVNDEWHRLFLVEFFDCFRTL